MKRLIKVLIVTFLFFGIYFYLDELYFRTLRSWLDASIHELGISHIITYLLLGIPIFVGIRLLHKKDKFFKSIGLDQSIFKGFTIALLCTLPMFIGYAIIFELNSKISINTVLISVVAAGFFEEVYFRGFLFGQLFRYTRLGFILSILLGALLFGFVHLYQGTEINEIIGIFLVTFLGAILFAWTYVEWNYNLWVPIFLHMLMNFAWELFSVSDNALGGIYSNVFRIITIVMIIMLTLIYKRRNKISLEVNRKTIFMRLENLSQK